MSTPNFYSNLKTVFAIDATYDWEIEDAEANILETLKNDKTLHVEIRDGYDDSNRSYGGRIFGAISFKNSNGVLYAYAELITRSGYYGGANFDARIYIQDDYVGEQHEVEDISPDDVAYALETKSTARIESAIRRLESEASRLEKKITTVFEQFTDPLIRVATFSNGEAIYERKNSKATA